MKTLSTFVKYRCARQGSAFSLRGESSTTIDSMDVSYLRLNQNTFCIQNDVHYKRPIRTYEPDVSDILGYMRGSSGKWSSYPKRRFFSWRSLASDVTVFNIDNLAIIESGFSPYAMFIDESNRGGAGSFDNYREEEAYEMYLTLYHDISREDEIWTEVADSMRATLSQPRVSLDMTSYGQCNIEHIEK